MSTQTTSNTQPGSVSTPEAATNTTAPATTSAPTTPTTTNSYTSAPDFPSSTCCEGQAIEAGQYTAPKWFGIPMTMQVGDGWKVMNEGAALLLAIVRGATDPPNLPSELIVILDASSAGSVDTLIEQFGKEPSITSLGEATEAHLAGFAGMQQDFSVLANPDNLGNAANDIPPGVRTIPVMGQFFRPGFSWISSSPEARLRVIVVDTSDSLLLVTLEAPPDDFENLVADADEILRTLTPLEP